MELISSFSKPKIPQNSSKFLVSFATVGEISVGPGGPLNNLITKWAIFCAKVYFSNFSKAFQTFLSETIFPKKFEKFDFQTFQTFFDQKV